MDTTKNERGLRHLSLCSGYDGIGIGIERAGIEIGFTIHVEIEAFAASNLVNKIEAGALGAGVHYPDLKTFPFRKFRGCVDILSGGFPCQPFSAAGKGAGDEDPRHLFPFIKKGIAACRPALVVLENVEGIVSAKLKGDQWNDPAGTPVLLHVIRELERVGYRATAVPTSASEVGAPHQRNRWFIIGVADSLCGRGEISDSGIFSGLKMSVSDGSARGAWPSGPGRDQFDWEPPRTVGKFQGPHNLHKTGYPEYKRALGDADSQPRRTHAEGRGDQAEAGSAGEEMGHAPGNDERRESESAMHRERIEVGGSDGSGGLGEPSNPGLPERGTGALGEQSGAEPKSERPRSDERGEAERKIESEMGRDFARTPCGLGYAFLQTASDNRTDELRLLGNGVVPQSCADAVRRGLAELLG